MSVYFAAGALVVQGYRTTFIKPDCLLEVATDDEAVGRRGDAGGGTGKSSGQNVRVGSTAEVIMADWIGSF